MRSISCCISDAELAALAADDELAPWLVFEAVVVFLLGLDKERFVVLGVLSIDRFADDKSAVTRVIMMRLSNRCFRKSNM